eukprot:647188-Prorocentrum_minimum.AAC.2
MAQGSWSWAPPPPVTFGAQHKSKLPHVRITFPSFPLAGDAPSTSRVQRESDRVGPQDISREPSTNGGIQNTVGDDSRDEEQLNAKSREEPQALEKMCATTPSRTQPEAKQSETARARSGKVPQGHLEVAPAGDNTAEHAMREEEEARHRPEPATRETPNGGKAANIETRGLEELAGTKRPRGCLSESRIDDDDPRVMVDYTDIQVEGSSKPIQNVESPSSPTTLRRSQRRKPNPTGMPPLPPYPIPIDIATCEVGSLYVINGPCNA